MYWTSPLTYSYAGTDIFIPKPAGMTNISVTFGVVTGSRIFIWGRRADNSTSWLGMNRDPPGGAGPFTDSVPSDVVDFRIVAATPSGSTAELNIAYYVPDTYSPYCAYGTQPTTLGTYMYYLTPGLIDVFLVEAGFPWLAPYLTAFWGAAIDVRTMCGSGPPAMPELTVGDLLWPAIGSVTPLKPVADLFNSGKLGQALLALAWPHFCECKPAPAGNPAPTPPPLPAAQTEPAGAVAPSGLVCDATDLCGILNQIGMVVSWNLRMLGQLVRAQARVETSTAPGSLVHGAAHTGLAGSGELAVTTPAGLVVQLTTVPSWLGRTPYAATDIWGVGELSLGNADGWLTRNRVEHNPHLYVPIPSGVTRVGYRLTGGVVGDLVELQVPDVLA